MTEDRMFGGKRVVVYARASAKQCDMPGGALACQVEAAGRWIERNGAINVGTFADKASAAMDDRPAFHDLIELADSDDRPVDIILVESLSRCFRRTDDAARYRERLDRRGVEIVSLADCSGDDRTVRPVRV